MYGRFLAGRGDPVPGGTSPVRPITFEIDRRSSTNRKSGSEEESEGSPQDALGQVHGIHCRQQGHNPQGEGKLSAQPEGQAQHTTFWIFTDSRRIHAITGCVTASCGRTKPVRGTAGLTVIDSLAPRVGSRSTLGAAALTTGIPLHVDPALNVDMHRRGLGHGQRAVEFCGGTSQRGLSSAGGDGRSNGRLSLPRSRRISIGPLVLCEMFSRQSR